MSCRVGPDVRGIMEHLDIMVERIQRGVVITFHVNDCHVAARLHQPDHFGHGFWQISKVVSGETTGDQIKRFRRKRDGLGDSINGFQSDPAFCRQPPTLSKHPRSGVHCDNPRCYPGKSKGRMPSTARNIAN